mmetsp:Transcript_58379/g.161484  ORF Transcript_58379/g.161484 Transcript_58379/m.161484 type:complete len:462 (-) Transcript_58379:677-2062(-)
MTAIRLAPPPAKANSSSRMWPSSSSCVLRYTASYSLSTSSESGRRTEDSLRLRCNARRRLRWPPPPHEVEQWPQLFQSRQVQKRRSWHLHGQGCTCSVSVGLQFLPPCFAGVRRRRNRFRSPLHLRQAPQSCQSLYLQSTGSRPRPQLSRPHSWIWARGPAQARPPFEGAWRMSRLRKFWPPSQLALQMLHCLQSPSSQSWGSSPATKQPLGAFPLGPGLHGHVSCSAPTHHLPRPRPYRATCLERRFTPLQLAEQSLQWVHCVSLQSTSSSHGRPTLQSRSSRSLPTGSRPQSLAVTDTARLRSATPPAHVLEQGDQEPQSAHSPSWQWASHDCVLHGSTCSLSPGRHAMPPFSGACSTERLLLRVPPPQLQLQLPQSLHRLHSQSWIVQSPCVAHARICPRSAWQPVPSRPRTPLILRLRVSWPTPQVLEQLLQSLHSLSWQSLGLQGTLLQPCVSMSS